MQNRWRLHSRLSRQRHFQVSQLTRVEIHGYHLVLIARKRMPTPSITTRQWIIILSSKRPSPQKVQPWRALGTNKSKDHMNQLAQNMLIQTKKRQKCSWKLRGSRMRHWTQLKQWVWQKLSKTSAITRNSLW